MIVKFGGITEEIRYRVDDDIEQIHDTYPSEKMIDIAILKYFDGMCKKNEKFYNAFLGLLASDDYKSLYIRNKEYGLEMHEKERLFVYDDLARDDAAKYIEQNPRLLIHCVYEMSEFSLSTFFMKRQMLNDCNEKQDVILKLSSLSLYDYLYYCQLFSAELFKEIFENNLEIGYSVNESVSCILSATQELFMSNITNYKDVMEQLLIDYYLIGKNSLFAKNHYNLISFIEKSDIVDILNFLTQRNVMFDILKTYLTFDGDVSSLKVGGKSEMETIKKIKRIKEF